MAASIAVPTAGGVGRSLTNYGVGILAGIGYRMVSGITGSGLIGGAISAAVTGAMVRGVAGEIIAVNAGFATGQQGLGNLGLGNALGRLTGNGGDDGPGLELV